ncbi:stage III sporulation protein AG [Hazenella coriacea]|uniref:Stage III sporulation protein AG n=1 Tax=Hazenella coriacea TaxID=1179467 RepID=A0A4R3LB23_9BACL|nr:stage III sporulation protein AG [Hazenella coriacea]TCS96390.1 stage III sporulation protein AG [Hazenella coriacea]
MFKNLFTQNNDESEKGKAKNKLPWLLVLGGAGVMVLIFSSFMGQGDPKPLESNSIIPENPSKSVEAKVVSSMQSYEEEYEKQLSEVLSKIVGVEDVSVVVNLDSTEEEVVQVNERDSEQVTTEVDKAGGNRSITQNTHDKQAAFYNGKEGQHPVVVKRLKPKVRGVLVVARGVENLQVKSIVIEAVQRILDVPMHRISVQPKG